MNAPLIPLLQFFVATKEIQGRKKCQKIIHILQECGYNFGFDFKLALYGAYASDLQSQLEIFAENEYIIEKPDVTGVANFRTSKFFVGEKAGRILDDLGLISEPAWKELAIALNSRQTRDLEAMSTILFLKRSGTSYGSEMKEQFAMLKPHLVDSFQSALEACGNLPVPSSLS